MVDNKAWLVFSLSLFIPKVLDEYEVRAVCKSVRFSTLNSENYCFEDVGFA